MLGGRYRAPPGSAAPRANALVVLEDDPRELVRGIPRERVEVEGQRPAVVVGAQDRGGPEDGVAFLPRGKREPDLRPGTGQLAVEVAHEHAALADVEGAAVELLTRVLLRDHDGRGQGGTHVPAAAQELVRGRERDPQRARGQLRRLLDLPADAVDAVVGHVLDSAALAV